MADELLQCFAAATRQTEKWRHFFPIYERILAPFRGRPITLLEIGVDHGGSLQAWRAYLGPSARIVGIDIDPSAREVEADGFEILIGDQSDPAFWTQEVARIGPLDVVIDDGGHHSVDQIVTVACALPHVRDGGVIAVEDTHTAFIPKQYPASRRFGFMAFAHHIVNVLHGHNPAATEPVADSMGLGRAIHGVQFFNSLVIFHVDRRLCAPAVLFQAGSVTTSGSDAGRPTLTEAARAAVESQPRWIQQLLGPARRLIGRLSRAAIRREDANRVRRYFR